MKAAAAIADTPISVITAVPGTAWPTVSAGIERNRAGDSASISPVGRSPMTVRIFTATLAVIGVAIVAAVVSYSHMQLLARQAGEDWRSWLIPLSVDGLVVAASMVLLDNRTHRFAWLALVTGVVASLAANMAAAAQHGAAAVLVAGWAPVAFAAALHLLLSQRRAASQPAALLQSQPDQSAKTTASVTAGLVTSPLRTPAESGLASTPAPSPAPSTTQPQSVRVAPAVTSLRGVAPAVQSSAPAAALKPPRQAPPRPEVKESGSGPRRSVSVDDVRPLIHAGLGRNAIAQRLGIGTGTARRLIADANAEGGHLVAVP